MSGLLALASRTQEAVSLRHCESQLSRDPSSAAQLAARHGPASPACPQHSQFQAPSPGSTLCSHPSRRASSAR